MAPRRPSAQSGNAVTAQRWSDHLRAVGHQVDLATVDESSTTPDQVLAEALDRAEVALVLHARRGASVVDWWRERRPDRPVIVALTGTDLYADMPQDPLAMAAAQSADALIVLQEAARDRVGSFAPRWSDKTSVVHQSVDPELLPPRDPVDDELRVVVLAHLRAVKDPLLAARAARLLPSASQVRVHHGGAALEPGWEAQARDEAAGNHRYRWHRELSRPESLRLLASSHLLACTSVVEGGANVVSEALALGVPVIGTRIDGNTGLLGDDHPGLVPVGDDGALAQVLERFETDASFRAELQARTDERRPLTLPASERQSLVAVLGRVLNDERAREDLATTSIDRPPQPDGDRSRFGE